MRLHSYRPFQHHRRLPLLPRRGIGVFANGGNGHGREPRVKLNRGVPVEGPDLSVHVKGLKLPNPFLIASGPPGTNYAVMKRAFHEGWGGVICKTLTLNASLMQNVTPRYAQTRSIAEHEVVGWENIELIGDRPLETVLEEMRRLRDEFPDRILIGSIAEVYKREAWEEIIERVEAVGVDGLELNFSCPHGLPDMGMGMSMGQNPETLREVCGWVSEKATVPVWAKMTPNITNITAPARESLLGGCDGISAINTISSISGVDLDTLKPLPTVEGHTTTGGYSYRAVKPIALAHVQKCASLIANEFDGQKSVSGIGGIDSGSDAAEFLLMGASTVQVCTGVMIHGYSLVGNLCAELQEFMKKHEFESVDSFIGAALPYVTSHAELVRLQKEAKKQRKEAAHRLITDADWTAEKFSNEAQSMVSN